jgi:hypothetical protein
MIIELPWGPTLDRERAVDKLQQKVLLEEPNAKPTILSRPYRSSGLFIRQLVRFGPEGELHANER